MLIVLPSNENTKKEKPAVAESPSFSKAYPMTCTGMKMSKTGRMKMRMRKKRSEIGRNSILDYSKQHVGVNP